MDTMWQYTGGLYDVDLVAMLPEAYLLAMILGLVLYGVVVGTRRGAKYPVLVGNLAWLTIGVALLGVLLLVNMPGLEASLWYHTLVVDEFGRGVKVLTLLATALALYLSLDYLGRESITSFEYVLLLALASLGMVLLASAADCVTMYLAIELQSLALYVMAAIKRRSELSVEAGLKYFLLGAFSSGVLVLGCALIYLFAGTTHFGELAMLFAGGTAGVLATTTSLPVCELGIVCILVGLLFKMAAAPFHVWAPDVYEGAPMPVTLYMMVVPKLALLTVFYRVYLGAFFSLWAPWRPLLVGTLLASLAVGSLWGVGQHHLKRLLAYSSVAHMAYILNGAATGTLEGVQASLLYLVLYMVMTFHLWSVLLGGLRRGVSPEVPHPTRLADLGTTMRIHGLLGMVLALSMFSMAGIPPLMGFYSKAMVFWTSLQSGLYLVALVAVVSSVVSCMIYLRVVRAVYFDLGERWTSYLRLAPAQLHVMALATGALLLYMVYPGPLYQYTLAIAVQLCS
jgi:NADH-quinone oxidoreductase subunit N